MRAARFRKDTRALTIEEVPTPEPPRGFVRVRVDACGICGSDVSLLAGTVQPAPDVVTPGHEAAGTIDAVGEDVPSIWSEGQPVVIAPGRACRMCEGCANSGGSACVNLKVMGFDFDGALAEYVLAPHQALVAVPADRPMAEWAVLSDAVATPFAALTETGQLRVAEGVAIWGVGGIGLPAVQIARALGAAPIIAVDPRSSSRERALAIGADLALDPDADDVRDRILAATRGRGLDLVLDNVGTSAIRGSRRKSATTANRHSSRAASRVGSTPPKRSSASRRAASGVIPARMFFSICCSMWNWISSSSRASGRSSCRRMGDLRLRWPSIRG